LPPRSCRSYLLGNTFPRLKGASREAQCSKRLVSPSGLEFRTSLFSSRSAPSGRVGSGVGSSSPPGASLGVRNLPQGLGPPGKKSTRHFLFLCFLLSQRSFQPANASCGRTSQASEPRFRAAAPLEVLATRDAPCGTPQATTTTPLDGPESLKGLS